MDDSIRMLAKRKGTGVVIGDIIVDEYYLGDCDYSHNEQCSVFKVNKVHYFAGNAANIANGIASLKQEVYLLGVVGNNFGSEKLRDILHPLVNSNMVITDIGRSTSIKTRINSNEFKLRIDQGHEYLISSDVEDQLIKSFVELVDRVSYVLLSDWGEGTLSDKLTREIINLAKVAGKPVLIDPRGKNPEKYRGATFLTPNINELNDLMHSCHETFQDAVPYLRQFQEDFNIDYLIFKDGERGSLLSSIEELVHCEPLADACECDIGAGDSLISAFAVSISKSIPIQEAFFISNIAAAITISNKYTYCVTLKDIFSHEYDYHDKMTSIKLSGVEFSDNE
jgi:rfaE bifunctional protein kinase chain/domain